MYKLFTIEEAVNGKFPDYERLPTDDAAFYNCIYYIYEDKPNMLVGHDYGELEDRILTRDLKWVLEELNHLNVEIVAQHDDYEQLHYDYKSLKEKYDGLLGKLSFYQMELEDLKETVASLKDKN